MIATRVSGDPVGGNNGLFYVYSDHLGSSSVLVNSSNNTVVNGSRTWYLPFGGYRPGSAPTQTITDRDFTGQHENMELGLLYYNARFYAPTLGRFISADTIIPNPANPQSYNRYSYVRNSPLNRIDPTGHLDDCSILGDPNDIQACNDPKPPTPSGPMVSFGGEGWTTESQGAVSTGALITGTALADAIMEQHPSWGYISPRDAFMLTYHGTVRFNRTGGSCTDDSRNTIPVCGARTEGRNLITVYTDADIITNKSHWARHELGHAFVYAVGGTTVMDLVNAAIDNNPLLDRGAADGYYGFASDQSSPRKWQQSVGDAGTAHTEIWADMYLGWTSNSWETKADGSFTARGEARSNFMSSITPLLVDIAIGR
jgi:RHS repeat-associated protein